MVRSYEQSSKKPPETIQQYDDKLSAEKDKFRVVNLEIRKGILYPDPF